MFTKRLILSGLVLALVFAAATPAAVAQRRSKTAVLYGDSILAETKPVLLRQMREVKPWSVRIGAEPATSPCDWLPQLRGDLVSLRPEVVAMESTGLSKWRCMIDPTTGAPYEIGSQAWEAKYRAALATFFASVTATGAQAMFIAAPPDAWTGTLAAEPVLNIAAQEAAQYSGASLQIGPAMVVTEDGSFTSTLPCLTIELAKKGCVMGRIAVRGADGLHLCPRPWVANGPRACPVYSSGEFRYARAIAATIAAS